MLVLLNGHYGRRERNVGWGHGVLDLHWRWIISTFVCMCVRICTFVFPAPPTERTRNTWRSSHKLTSHPDLGFWLQSPLKWNQVCLEKRLCSRLSRRSKSGPGTPGAREQGTTQRIMRDGRAASLGSRQPIASIKKSNYIRAKKLKQ